MMKHYYLHSHYQSQDRHKPDPKLCKFIKTNCEKELNFVKISIIFQKKVVPCVQEFLEIEEGKILQLWPQFSNKDSISKIL